MRHGASSRLTGFGRLQLEHYNLGRLPVVLPAERIAACVARKFWMFSARIANRSRHGFADLFSTINHEIFLSSRY
ncbi:hypothetical protein WT02_21120 [Burkholderia stagnalis]|nr:hypothetical protein WT02_21120 [Burkholderia stagnalis]